MADQQSGQFQQPYLFGEGKTALETPMQGEMYVDAPEMESQWKQPWRADSYPKMEWELAIPGAPSYPQAPGGQPADCEIKGTIDGKNLLPCNGTFGFIFNCAANIVRLVPIAGKILNVIRQSYDTLTGVAAISAQQRDDGVRFGATAFDKHGHSFFVAVIPKCECQDVSCKVAAPLSIGYTSQQMVCNGTQTLTAVGGVGTPKHPYTWAITAGTGTLSASTGSSVIYTAPATNSQCGNNPTITLTDCCETVATLQIALNCSANNTDPAVNVETAVNAACEDVSGVGRCKRDCIVYKCTGAVHSSFRCDGGACTFPLACSPIGGSCSPVVGNGTDLRTAAMKSQGCCPQQLLGLAICP